MHYRTTNYQSNKPRPWKSPAFHLQHFAQHACSEPQLNIKHSSTIFISSNSHVPHPSAASHGLPPHLYRVSSSHQVCMFFADVALQQQHSSLATSSSPRATQ